MSNKNKTIALASLIAAGAGVAAVAASNSHKQAKAKKIAEKQQAESGTPYRNTERGKYEKSGGRAFSKSGLRAYFQNQRILKYQLQRRSNDGK